MSTKEHQNIKEFLSGLSNVTKRKEFVKKLDPQNNKSEKEMKSSNNKDFDAQNAWLNLHNRLEKDGLLTSKNKKTININYFSRIAASVILILGLTISAYYIFKADTYVKITSTEGNKDVFLPDGSQVTLNSNSSMKYPTEFEDNIREIEFSGEAFFEIQKNPEKPFVIKTDDAKVKVLGTSFNLQSRKKLTNLTVTTGKVQLSKRNDLSESIILEVGEKGSLINDKLIKEKNSDTNYLSWKTKNFYFIDSSLEQVFSDLSKAYKTEIILEEKDIGNLKFTSNKSFTNYQLDTIFEIIFIMHPTLKKEEKGGKIIISKNK